MLTHVWFGSSTCCVIPWKPLAGIGTGLQQAYSHVAFYLSSTRLETHLAGPSSRSLHQGLQPPAYTIVRVVKNTWTFTLNHPLSFPFPGVCLRLYFFTAVQIAKLPSQCYSNRTSSYSIVAIYIFTWERSSMVSGWSKTLLGKMIEHVTWTNWAAKKKNSLITKAYNLLANKWYFPT